MYTSCLMVSNVFKRCVTKVLKFVQLKVLHINNVSDEASTDPGTYK